MKAKQENDVLNGEPLIVEAEWVGEYRKKLLLRKAYEKMIWLVLGLLVGIIPLLLMTF